MINNKQKICQAVKIVLISYKFNNYCSFAKEAEFDLLALDDNIKYQFPDQTGNIQTTEETLCYILKTTTVKALTPTY